MRGLARAALKARLSRGHDSHASTSATFATANPEAALHPTPADHASTDRTIEPASRGVRVSTPGLPGVSGSPAVSGLLLSGLLLTALACSYLGWQGRLFPVEALGLGILAACIGFSVRRMLEPAPARPAETPAAVALDHFGDLITWHRPNGEVLAATLTPGHDLGLTASRLHGKGLLDLVHVADRPLFLQTLSDATHGSGPAICTVRLLIRPDASTPASTHWLDIRARRIGQDPSRSDAMVVAALRDVTQRREQDEARERVRLQAETSATARGNFLATVSHELRTPLNAIIGFSEMLSNEALRPADTAQQFEYARIIHSSGHHLLDVVNALLDVSKIESGAMTLDREPADIGLLVGNCCDLMDIKANASGIRLERVIGKGLEQVVCDRRAIKQIVINLLSNALKFTPRGGDVTIAAVLDGRMVDISVTDSGIGIHADDLPRLGQPFFQARSSYDRDFEGTGLGLSVVRGLVGLHGGRLEIESAPDAGTRVSLRIPVDGDNASTEPTPIATFIKPPPRGLTHLEPYRLTA